MFLNFYDHLIKTEQDERKEKEKEWMCILPCSVLGTGAEGSAQKTALLPAGSGAGHANIRVHIPASWLRAQTPSSSWGCEKCTLYAGMSAERAGSLCRHIVPTMDRSCQNQPNIAHSLVFPNIERC